MMRSRIVALIALLVAGFLLPALAEQPATVAKIGDKAITLEQLRQNAASQLAKLRDQEYQILRNALDQMIEDELIKDAAAKENKTPDQFVSDAIDKLVVPPTDAEIQKTYDQYKSKLGGQTLEQAKPQIVSFLTRTQKQTLYSNMITDLRQKSSVKVMLEAPRIAVKEEGNPAKGSASAPVTIIEFSDYQCPYCKKGDDTVKQIFDVYGDRIRFVFRDYPLSFHANAQKAAEAAGCALEQGKFWEMHEKMFSNQGALDVPSLKQYATALGIDAAKFAECLDSNKRAAEVTKDLNDGMAVGVTGTPAFFVNGRLVGGAAPFDNFARIIDEELELKGLPIPPKPAPKPAVAAPAPAKPAAAAAPTPAKPAPAPAKPEPPKAPAQPAKK